jgi:hypothetical protein
MLEKEECNEENSHSYRKSNDASVNIKYAKKHN